MTANVISGLLLIGLCTGVLVLSAGLPPAVTSEPGPSFFPDLVAGFGLVLGFLLVVRAILRRHVLRKAALGVPGGGIPALYLRRGGIVLVLSVLYTVVLHPLGFLAATFLFILIAMFTLGERRVVPLLAYPVLLTALVFLLFSVWLQVPLPRAELF